MTRLGLDTFQHADQAGWPAATDGQTWTQTGPGTRSTASNEGVLVSIGADTHVRMGTATSGDAEIVCRVSLNNANDVVGLQSRFSVSGGNTTCYKFLFYSAGIHVNKAVSGANSNLANAVFTLTTNTFYWMRFRLAGTVCWGKMWADGTAEPGSWMITATDSGVTGVGGVAVLGNTDAASTGIKIDNFYAVDYVAIEQLASFDATSSASGTLTVSEQIVSADATLSVTGEQTSIERLTVFDAESSASGTMTTTEQLNSASAEPTVLGEMTFIEALQLLDAISIAGVQTSTEQRATFSAEATVSKTIAKYSVITFTCSTGDITFTAI